MKLIKYTNNTPWKNIYLSYKRETGGENTYGWRIFDHPPKNIDTNKE